MLFTNDQKCIWFCTCRITFIWINLVKIDFEIKYFMFGSLIWEIILTKIKKVKKNLETTNFHFHLKLILNKELILKNGSKRKLNKMKKIQN